MSAPQNYVLWCVNNSSSPGNICVYQDAGNVALAGVSPLQTLAWLVVGSNPGGQIKFMWSTSYDFAWFNHGSTLTQSIVSASVGQKVVLSKNQYGYVFSTPVAGDASALTIATDTTIPATNSAIAGIGMDGAGTFGVSAMPNISTTFTPSANLSYWISFGYNGDVNDVLNPASMNAPQQITFPPGIIVMTATYQTNGTWALTQGAPGTASFSTKSTTADIVVYNPADRAAQASNNP